MNWTTTKVPLWQIDCENFRKVHQPFELRDVTTAEHKLFVEMFAARYLMQYTERGTTVRFHPDELPAPTKDKRE